MRRKMTDEERQNLIKSRSSITELLTAIGVATNDTVQEEIKVSVWEELREDDKYNITHLQAKEELINKYDREEYVKIVGENRSIEAYIVSLSVRRVQERIIFYILENLMYCSVKKTGADSTESFIENIDSRADLKVVDADGSTYTVEVQTTFLKDIKIKYSKYKQAKIIDNYVLLIIRYDYNDLAKVDIATMKIDKLNKFGTYTDRLYSEHEKKSGYIVNQDKLYFMSLTEFILNFLRDSITYTMQKVYTA